MRPQNHEIQVLGRQQKPIDVSEDPAQIRGDTYCHQLKVDVPRGGPAGSGV